MSEFNPLVSIVIPVYNGANYMREAIDSALAQTYDHCEILVINDGSTDNGATDRIARSYGDRIRYFSKENGGVATALNLGIREMRGEYFSWLSHDDLYVPEKIATQVAFMERFELQDAVLYSDYTIIDSKGAIVAEKRLPCPPPDCCFQYLYLTPEMHGCTLLVPHKAFSGVGLFPEHLKTTQDYDLWMRMCQVYSFVHQAKLLVLSRAHLAQGTYTIPGHKEAIASFYRQYLPTLVEITTGNKAPDEAARSRVQLVGQLYRRNLDAQAEEVATLSTSDAEWAELSALKQTIRNERRKQATIACIKKILRPVKALLPADVAAKIKIAVQKFLGKHRSENDSFFKIQRLDFRQYYIENKFGANESFSGGGSSLFQTRIVRRELPSLLQKLHIGSMLDIPCGDFNWMRYVDLSSVQYKGGDIVKELVERNRDRYGTAKCSFEYLNAISGPLPVVDLIFCRDCLVHLPFVDALKAMQTFKASGSRWLLITTFLDRKENSDLAGCVWRPLNLCLSPFYLPEPVLTIDEKCVEHGGIFIDKALGLWDLQVL